MVGVPKSLGCDACRAQKKKCLVNVRPPCARCVRLKIQCAGYGQRRFKFKEEYAVSIVGHGQTEIPDSRKLAAGCNSLTTLCKSSGEHIRDPTDSVSRSPTNGLSRLVASLVHTLNRQGSNPCFHLIWVYGSFLSDIPQHLGSNESLDSAIDALTTSYDQFRVRSKAASSEVTLRKYSRALTDLRCHLSTTDKACEPTTLCTIMILMIVESLIGNVDSLQHAGGAAKILKCRGTRSPRNELERKVLMTLRGPVVVQAFCHPESYFTDAEWTGIVTGCSAADRVDNEDFFCYLAATTRLFQKTRTAFSQSNMLKEEAVELVSRVTALRRATEDWLRYQSHRLEDIQRLHTMNRDDAVIDIDHFSVTRDYGMTLMTLILVNHLMAALSPDSREQVDNENAALCQAICHLTDDVRRYRPLGSLWFPLVLCVGYAGTTGSDQKCKVAELLADFTITSSDVHISTQSSQLDSFACYVKLEDLSIT